jgi:putative endopeptidase
LIDFYDGAEYMGGKVDGELTLSENLADLGGLAISLHALQSELPQDAATRKKAYVDFFTSYAVSWRNKDRAKKAKEALSLDVHAPARLRVNFIVHQFAEFYEAFDIGPEEAGFIPPEKRIRLW